MSIPKNKILRPKKTILLLFFAFISVLSPNATPAKAWETIPAFLMHEAWLTVTETIKGIQLGMAQQAAAEALSRQMSFLITGRSTGGAMFVTNWQSYLTRQPQMQANIFINDYISQVTRGRGSITGYIPAGSEGVGVNFSFTGQMAQSARNITSGQTQAQVTFRGDPSRIFSGAKPFQNLNLYLSGINNPWAFNINVQQKYQEELQQQQLIAQTKATSSGFLPLESNGAVVNPAGLIQAQVAKVQNMGIDIITNAKNLPQVISGAVSMTINQAMRSGIGQMEAMAQREISGVRNNVNNQLNSAVRQVGPGALYNQIRR